MNRHDHSGQTFGDWKVLSKDADVVGKPSAEGYQRLYDRWICRCICGKERPVFGQSLRNRTSTGCGCTKWKTQGEAMKKPDAAFLHIMSRYRASAKEHSRIWELTEFQASVLFTSNCHYCGEPPRREHMVRLGQTFTYNGIDRVDSTKGYVFENCVPCCTTCNRMKLDSSKDDFLQQCARIVRRHNLLVKEAAC